MAYFDPSFSSVPGASRCEEGELEEQGVLVQNNAISSVATSVLFQGEEENPVDIQHLKKKVTEIGPLEFSPIFDVFQFVSDLDDLWDFVDDGDLFQLDEQRRQGLVEEGNFVDRKTFFKVFYEQSGRILRYTERDFKGITNEKLRSKLQACQKLLRASLERLVYQYKNGTKDETFRKELRKHLMSIGRGFLHCYDRIEQECEMVYNDLYGNTRGLFTVEEEVLSHLRVLRGEILGQIVVEIGNGNDFREIDISSTVQHYRSLMGEELGLKTSTGSCFKLAPKHLEPEIRERFKKSYTFPVMVDYLDSQMKKGKLPFLRVYSWFEDRFSGDSLGDNIFDPEKVLFRLSAWKVLLQSMQVLH